jgi:dynein heavy chain
MVRIPFFARYRVWKGFRIWRQNVRFAKSHAARTFLGKSLFFLDPVLSMSLIDLRSKCVKIMGNRMINLDKIDQQTFDLEDFHRNQRSLVEFKISPLLQEFEKECALIVDNACRNALEASGFFLHVGEGNDGQLPPVLAIQKSQDPNQTLTYTEQAARRKACNRLLRFVKLADYYVVSALHHMAVSSAKELFRIVFKNCGENDIVLEEGYRFFKELVDNFLVSTAVIKPKYADSDEDYNRISKDPNALFRVEMLSRTGVPPLPRGIQQCH